MQKHAARTHSGLSVDSSIFLAVGVPTETKGLCHVSLVNQSDVAAGHMDFRHLDSVARPAAQYKNIAD
jgi:hypothetical protein